MWGCGDTVPAPAETVWGTRCQPEQGHGDCVGHMGTWGQLQGGHCVGTLSPTVGTVWGTWCQTERGHRDRVWGQCGAQGHSAIPMVGTVGHMGTQPQRATVRGH